MSEKVCIPSLLAEVAIALVHRPPQFLATDQRTRQTPKHHAGTAILMASILVYCLHWISKPTTVFSLDVVDNGQPCSIRGDRPTLIWTILVIVYNHDNPAIVCGLHLEIQSIVNGNKGCSMREAPDTFLWIHRSGKPTQTFCILFSHNTLAHVPVHEIVYIRPTADRQRLGTCRQHMTHTTIKPTICAYGTRIDSGPRCHLANHSE